MFISKKRWNVILSDIYGLQEDVFLLQVMHNRYKKLLNELIDEKSKAKERHPASKHPASINKTTTKKVEKNGK